MRLIELPTEWGHRGFLHDPLGYISMCLDEIKYFFQRGWRGYSDKDFWNAEDHLSYIICEACETLRVRGMGIPSKYETEDEWHQVLEEIKHGFKLYKDHHYEEDPEKWEKPLARSFKLLEENFGFLWD